MSASDLTLVQEFDGVFDRLDASAVFARFDSEVEIHQTERLPWGGHNRGGATARESFSGGCSGPPIPP